MIPSRNPKYGYELGEKWAWVFGILFVLVIIKILLEQFLS